MNNIIDSLHNIPFMYTSFEMVFRFWLEVSHIELYRIVSNLFKMILFFTMNSGQVELRQNMARSNQSRFV